jgi:hypothetical protein
MPNTYKDIPQPGDILATSQGDIEHNFLYLANTLGTSSKAGDHQISVNGVDNTSFEGRHRQVCLSNRNGGVPTVAGIGDGTNALLYSNNGNIFFGSANGAGAFQLTTYNAGSNFGGTNTGWTFLPGGLMLLYGVIAPNSSTTNTVNFAALTLPNFPTAIFQAQVTRQRTTSDPGSSYEYYVDNTTLAQTGFNIINRDGHTYGYYWMAIGN